MVLQPPKTTGCAPWEKLHRKLPRSLTRRLPCAACRPIREKHPLRIAPPIEVFLNEDGAHFRCHRCGRTGPIDRSTIPLF